MKLTRNQLRKLILEEINLQNEMFWKRRSQQAQERKDAAARRHRAELDLALDQCQGQLGNERGTIEEMKDGGDRLRVKQTSNKQ